MELVAGRQCGACKVCCYALTIEELKKPPGVVCPHWTESAHCTVYETRPWSCRHWYCGWRFLPLGEDWRPDRCEIVIIPAGRLDPIRLEDGLQFELIGGLDRLFWPPLVNAVMDFMPRNVPLYLSASAPVGYTSARTFLNGNAALRAAVVRRDFSAVARLMSEALQAALDRPKTNVDFGGAP